jgi:uncharacterized RmlC-like cupin family protein
MANVAKVILAAAIAAVSIASPALARSHHSAHHHFRIYNYSGGAEPVWFRRLVVVTFGKAEVRKALANRRSGC